ncbi:Soluble pyridine nucleotide transhydrogenase [hydrothermal vent metagenome]|uniref:NAD(P)(+) transhydrogenase (Si-specific) n=1 Tax=hydrothermal vent metagenome TaxID=652676 RepID=A0A3B0ZIR8_9ZZZZ
MSKYNYDVLVVGSGPGGKHAAIAAAHLGKKVGIIERKSKLGGVSLQTGTIPSKALREAAYLHSRFSARGMRTVASKSTNISDSEFLQEAIHTKNTIVDKQEAILLNQLMRNGITILPGEASFKDEHTLEILSPKGNKDTLSADIIILATGSRARRPKEIPFECDNVLDSSSILKLSRLPDSLAVIGGGVIACEFATIFAMLGVKITIIDSHENLLAYMDSDITHILEQHMLEMGINITLSTNITAVESDNKNVTIHTDGEEINTSHILYAIGRIPNVELLKIENAGLKAEDQGWIPVSENSQTCVDHIYVIGDLAGRPSLASTAMEQGRRAISHAYSKHYKHLSSPLPMAIYTIPELSYVGATELELKQDGVDYVSGHASYSESARGQIIGANNGYLKILTDRNTLRVLGVHIIGETASELIHVGQIVMGYNGTVEDLANNVYNYPTLAECYKSAALDCLNKLEQ